jgi:cobalt-zinc-cadmium efflux system outer membrane protein
MLIVGTKSLAAAFMLACTVGCQRYEASPLTSEKVNQQLQIPAKNELDLAASKIKHPLLAPVTLHPEMGLTPDEAAVLAVVVNPELRAIRDQHGSAQAALLQAGLLPNPVLGYSSDFVNGGFTAGTFNAYGATVSWDFEQLISHGAKEKAAGLSAQSVDLSIAWQEWQIAEAARQSVYDLISLQAQLEILEEIEQRLSDNYKTVQQAESTQLLTVVDVSAAEGAARDSHAAVLQARRDAEHQWFQLTRALGLPSDNRPRLRSGLTLESKFEVTDAGSLTADLENRRIDLLALHRGYDSQEQTLRAAILDQFPKINLGFNDASDNTNVHSIGLVATIDLPIFDRNQGVIAAERATRQKLFDEYISRVFDGRADVATAIADIKALNEQIADAAAAVPNLQRLVDGYKTAMDTGNADVLSYYQAWNNLAQKRLGVLRLQQQLADTKIAMELAAGRYFPDVPSTNPSVQTGFKK